MYTWNEITRATNARIIAWAEEQPWARDMAKCQQDPEWHAEGDVWTHTRMVCAELKKLDDWKALDRPRQLQLLFTALFHDAGKPATTVLDPETGRTRSPKHALVGAEICRQTLRSLGCDVITREQIVGLVRYHGRPPYLLEKENPEQDVITVSWLANNYLLYLFALADTRGRRTKDTSRTEDTLHLWKMIAEEQRCLDQSYPFANDQARVLFYRGKLSSLHYTPHEDYRCQVTMMSGLPGAGKDTWLSIHHPNLPTVSLDAIRADLDMDATDNQGQIIQAAREQCREHLRASRSFTFKATNVTRQIRQKWIDLFTDYNARIEIIYLEPPIDTIFQQNRERPSPVPANVICRLLDKLEPPSATEAHSVRFPVLFDA